MNTTTYNFTTNVTDNERAFRAIFGIGLSSVVSAGVITSPVAIFAVSAIAVYLVITAIIGTDPAYAASNLFSKATPVRRDDFVTA